MAGPSQSQPRLLLTGMKEIDRLALCFRRRLRDAAVELLEEAGDSAAIGPDTVLAAVPAACRGWLSDLDAE
jgi:hypothetical protein